MSAWRRKGQGKTYRGHSFQWALRSCSFMGLSVPPLSLVSCKRQEMERETGIPFLIVTDTTLSLFFVVASGPVRLRIGT